MNTREHRIVMTLIEIETRIKLGLFTQDEYMICVTEAMLAKMVLPCPAECPLRLPTEKSSLIKGTGCYWCFGRGFTRVP